MILKRVVEFTEALRRANVPVSLLETIDASKALESCGIIERKTLRAFLFATLIKDQSHKGVFDTLFSIYFASGLPPDFAASGLDEVGELRDGAEGEMEFLDDADLRRAIADSLYEKDQARLALAVAVSVSRYAGMEPGRPVAGVYYSFKTLRQLDPGEIRALMMQRATRDAPGADALARKLVNHQIDILLDRLKSYLDEEIRRRLVDDRGSEAVARSMKITLVEDIDFMHADSGELEEIRRSLQPLVRKLASSLSRRRSRGRFGTLDFRRTFHRSIAYGGVPAELVFHKARPAKPELVLVADISGSVAAFARFTLLMTYSLAGQFSRVRSFVFIDEVDEVTRIFDTAGDMGDAVREVNARAKVVWMDGHSDYGRVLERFWDRWGSEITPRTTILFLGDARNNYHASGAHVLGLLRSRAKAIHWLNPEPASYWNAGDSIVSDYALYCDSVNECRNLRQLEAFVSSLV